MTLADVDTFDAGFAAAIGGTQAASATREEPLIGLEHEYRLLNRAGSQVDFREVIHGLPVQGRRLDPGDLNAYRLTSGMALTCDEAEAEVVSPPVAIEPGFTGAVEGWAATGRELLAGWLPPGISLDGYSTHLSIAMPGHLNDAASELYAHTFAPALALMLERADSQGIYVRPRPGRLELCGEHVDGPRLGAAAAFAAGSAAACARMVIGDVLSETPPRLDVQLLPGKERYGLRVLRDAYGRDLYREGRHTVLKLESGGTIRAQEVLELCWAAARASLQASASTRDLDVAARMVSGALPLGVEGECPPVADRKPARPHGSPFGDLLAVRERPRFRVVPAAATWDFTVFRVEGARRLAYAGVPRPDLERFLERLDTGRLDELLAAYLDSPPRGRVLASRAQVESPGLHDSLGNPTDLLPEEREPAAWGEAGASATRPGKLPAGGARPGKRPAGKGRPGKVVVLPPLPAPSAREEATQTTPAAGGGGVPWPVIAAAIAAVIAAGVAVAVMFTGGDTDDMGATPTPGFQAVATSTAIPTASPTASPTATVTPTAKVDATALSPSATPVPGAATATPPVAAATATATVTEPATSTVAPTATKFATETPRPTSTPTPTPSPTPTKAPATATPRPTETPPKTPGGTVPPATPTPVIGHPTPDQT